MFKSVVNKEYLFTPLIFACTTKVVDESKFRPDSEQVRAIKFNPAGGLAGNPMYDYPDGKIPKDDKVTDTIVAIRSGKLDKADIDKLHRDIIETGKKTSAELKDAKLRQAVESTLGVDSSN